MAMAKLIEIALAVLARKAGVGELEGHLSAPCLELSLALPLTKMELLAATLAAAAELDVAAGRAIAKLQEPLGGSRPLVGLLAAVLGEPPEDLAGGEAIATGLLRLTGDSAPLVERALAMPAYLAAALGGSELLPP